MHFNSRGFEDLGKGQKTSEDFYLIDDSLNLHIVCDGSRNKDGRWAAETICTSIRKYMQTHADSIRRCAQDPVRENRMEVQKLLGEAVQEACRALYRESHVQRARLETHNSVVVGVFAGPYLIWTHVGSARLYLFRDQVVHRLSRDHTYMEEMQAAIPKGTAVNPIFRKRLTRAIGDCEVVPVVIHSVQLAAGDLFLFCSNGVSDGFSSDDRELGALASRKELSSISGGLIQNSHSANISDNLSGILVRVQDSEQARALFKRVPIGVQTQVDLLRRLLVFKGLHRQEEALVKLQGIVSFRSVQQGATILREGSASDELLVLLAGVADVWMNGRMVSRLGQNDIIGELGFFTRVVRSATVKAAGDCELMSIHRNDYDNLIKGEPALGVEILEGVVAQLGEKLLRHSAVGDGPAVRGPETVQAIQK